MCRGNPESGAMAVSEAAGGKDGMQGDEAGKRGNSIPGETPPPPELADIERDVHICRRTIQDPAFLDSVFEKIENLRAGAGRERLGETAEANSSVGRAGVLLRLRKLIAKAARLFRRPGSGG